MVTIEEVVFVMENTDRIVANIARVATTAHRVPPDNKNIFYPRRVQRMIKYTKDRILFQTGQVIEGRNRLPHSKRNAFRNYPFGFEMRKILSRYDSVWFFGIY